MTQQSLSTTMGSWGFDVNRSTNGQIPSLSHSNNHLNHNDPHTPSRTKNDISSPTSKFSIPRPTLTRQRNGNEFSAIDRLVRGPDSRSNLIFKTKSNEDLIMSPNSNLKSELMAWQNRMLQREKKTFVPSPSNPNNQHRTGRLNETQTEISQKLYPPTVSIRPTSAVSNVTESQRFEHDHHEPMIKTARLIKRYIELLYRLQTFYQRILDQLFNDAFLLSNDVSSVCPSLFMIHCRKIVERIENIKPTWDEKLIHLQHLLKDITKFRRSTVQPETMFLRRYSTLMSLMQNLIQQKELDTTHQSILSDVDRLFHEEKLAIQLQDELSTLLEHQSMLNDFIQLLQWNISIYPVNDRKRVENVLLFLREQMTTTEQYIIHVSQQLTELVLNLCSLERYVLSYTNSMPLLEEGVLGSSDDQSDRSPSSNMSRAKDLSKPTSNQRNRSSSLTKFGHSDQNKRLARDHHRNMDKENNVQTPETSARVATVRPTRHEPTPKSNGGILKSTNYMRTPSMDRISDLDMNGIGAEISKFNELDRSDDEERQPASPIRIRKSQERRHIGTRMRIDLNDSNISDDDVNSPFLIRKLGKNQVHSKQKPQFFNHAKDEIYINYSTDQDNYDPRRSYRPHPLHSKA